MNKVHNCNICNLDDVIIDFKLRFITSCFTGNGPSKSYNSHYSREALGVDKLHYSTCTVVISLIMSSWTY